MPMGSALVEYDHFPTGNWIGQARVYPCRSFGTMPDILIYETNEKLR